MSAVDSAIATLRLCANGQRLSYLRSRGSGRCEICIVDTSASIAWVIVQHADALKIRKGIKYVLLPESTFPSVDHMTSRGHTIVFRPSTQRIYEVQYYESREDTAWMQVQREHNLEKLTRVPSTQIPRGQRLIVDKVTLKRSRD